MSIANEILRLQNSKKSLKTFLEEKGYSITNERLDTLIEMAKNACSGSDTSDATATADDILSGKTAYVNDTKITGNIESKTAKTYIPTTKDQTIASGIYLAGEQIIKGDVNLVPSNIKKDVSLFGVSGTYEGGSGESTLKTLLDSTKTTYNLFNNYTGDNLNELMSYSDTENVTNFNYMYYYCKNATSFPLIDTSNGTNFNYMYGYCSSATSFPLINTSSGTNFNNMYYECSSATSFPASDTSSGTNFGNMYYNCTSATSFPALDTSSGTSFSSMYSGCSKATSFPALDTSSGTSFSSMYYQCSSATSFPLIDTSSGTSFSYMYYQCSSATSFPALDTSKGTDLRNMYYNCFDVEKIDISHFNISSTSNVNNWCNGCRTLKAVIIRSFGTNYILNTTSFTNCYHILGTTNATYNPNGDKDGYIYVPRDMIATLSSSTNWSTHASQLRALEDYTKDGTTTGEFDDEKAGLIDE